MHTMDQKTVSNRLLKATKRIPDSLSSFSASSRSRFGFYQVRRCDLLSAGILAEKSLRENARRRLLGSRLLASERERRAHLAA